MLVAEVQVSKWIKIRLETATNQYLVTILEYIHGAIAVMYIKVDDGDIVEQTEPKCGGDFGMMPWFV